MGLSLSAPSLDIDRPVLVLCDLLNHYNVARHLFSCTSRPFESRDLSFFPWYCETGDHSSSSNQLFNKTCTSFPLVNYPLASELDPLLLHPHHGFYGSGHDLKKGRPIWNKLLESSNFNSRKRSARFLSTLALKGTACTPSSIWKISRNLLTPLQREMTTSTQRCSSLHWRALR